MFNSNRKSLPAILLSIAIVIATDMVNAQTNQNFEALLDAYANAASKLNMYQHIDRPSEEIYWSQQYNFYRSKIEEQIDSVEKAAQENPRSFCLQALKMNSKFSDVNSKIFVYDQLPSLYGNYEHSRQLFDYCSRYDIYYDPNKEKM